MASESPLKHPEEWPVVRLADITVKIGSGATPRGGAENYLPERTGFALIRSQNVFDRYFDYSGLAFISDTQANELQNVIVQPGDLLLNITGDGVTFSRCCFVPEDVLPACVNQHVSIIRVDPTLADPGYVLAFLTHPIVKGYIESFNAGGSRRAITKGHIESFKLPLPPVNEQRTIARILRRPDDKIELNRNMCKTLEAMAWTIFKSWFVNFDPARAKAEGRSTSLPAHVASLFPGSFADSELGEIPTLWSVKSIGDLVELAYGKALKESDRRPGNVAVYGSNGQIGWHDERLVEGPGIIVGRKGNPGIVTWVPMDFFAIDTTFYVVPRTECRSLYFLFYALKEHDLASLGADSAVPGLNRNMAYLSKQLVPPSALLEAFDYQVRPLFDRIQKGKMESSSLAQMRDALLPRLIAGEIRLASSEQNEREIG
jgi:type I restriction enzyme, S subunit